ncbi:MAG: response regulator transcription factor [Polyangiaceae bacterium]
MKALVLEDDQKLARFLARVLSEEGLEVDLCARGVDAIAQAQGGMYDLIVLDWMVPETDGLAVCREIRRSGGVAPILMLTARGEISERVLALNAGVDDYMVKPFEVDEFAARVRSLLRRLSGFAALRCGELEVDPVSRQAKLADAVLTLTNREYAVLFHLLRRANQIVKRSDLLAQVWGMRFDPGSNLVDVHISRLRERFGDRAGMIETVRGVGYRLRQGVAAGADKAPSQSPDSVRGSTAHR